MTKRRVTPILLVTGFLGAGKTTLLAEWLRSPELAGAVAIVNEFGEVGIDDRLIRSSGEMVLLENGCACCTAGEDLAGALERIFWQQLHREIPPVPWVVIETTGVAEPRQILDMLTASPLLAERYRVAGVLTVVDGRKGPAQARAHAECRHQLEQASAVVITKTDLASLGELAAAEALAAALAPGAPLLHSARGTLPIEAVLAILGDGAVPHGVPCGAGHHHHDHAATLDSHFLELPDVLPGPALTAALRAAADRFGADLLRLKGIVKLREGGLGSVQLDPDGTVAFLPVALAAATARLGVTMITRACAAEDVARFVAARLNEAPAAGQAR